MKLDNLSLIGRLCYLFMCMEKYLITCYLERNWEIVAKKCWQWTSVYWNEGCDRYSIVVPEYLFEFSDCEKANTLVFDGMLSKKEYLELTNLFADLTTGNSEDELNQVLSLPIEFNNVCECISFREANTPTLMILYKMQHFLSLHHISFLSISNVQNMTVEQKNGWGICSDRGIERQENDMHISYKPLWHTLLEKNMRKEDLRLSAGLTTNMIANMGKEGKHISMDTLAKICEALDCRIMDVIELVDDEPCNIEGKKNRNS